MEKAARLVRAYRNRLRRDHLERPSLPLPHLELHLSGGKADPGGQGPEEGVFSRMASSTSTARRSSSLKSEARDMSSPVLPLMAR